MPLRAAAGAVIAAIAASTGTQAGLAAPAPTPFPQIAARKTECPRGLFKVSRVYTVTVVVAAEKGQHPSPASLACRNAYAIALAGKRYFLEPPFRTGEKIPGRGSRVHGGGRRTRRLAAHLRPGLRLVRERDRGAADDPVGQLTSPAASAHPRRAETAASTAPRVAEDRLPSSPAPRATARSRPPWKPGP